MPLKICRCGIVGALRRIGFGLAAAGFFAGAGQAQDLYSATVDAFTIIFEPETPPDVSSSSAAQSYNNVEDFVDAVLTSEGFASINPEYTLSSGVAVAANFRGVLINLNYDFGGTALTFSVPELGVTEVFDGGSRVASEDELDDYLTNNTDEIVTRILGLLVESTATDPVAGNPNSLQATMVQSDFGVGAGFGGFGTYSFDNSQRGFTAGPGTQIPGAAARFGNYSVGDVDGTVISLPLGYTIPLADPRYAIVLEAPITYVEANGTDSYSISFGGGFRIPILNNWAVTPTARLGTTGSEDVGSAATLYSLGVTSSYRFDVGSVGFNLANMVNYVATSGGSFEVDDFEIEYDLANTIFRNGLAIEGETGFELFGENVTWEGWVVNTMITGDEVFIDNYTDFAISFGTQASRNGFTWDAARLGLTYTIGNNDFSRLSVNFGYQF
ncbi:MAG: hypothetical protein AAF667_16395 [Pseudomonadota bacterium]